MPPASVSSSSPAACVVSRAGREAVAVKSRFASCSSEPSPGKGCLRRPSGSPFGWKLMISDACLWVTLLPPVGQATLSGNLLGLCWPGSWVVSPGLAASLVTGVVVPMPAVTPPALVRSCLGQLFWTFPIFSAVLLSPRVLELAMRQRQQAGGRAGT